MANDSTPFQLLFYAFHERLLINDDISVSGVVDRMLLNSTMAQYHIDVIKETLRRRRRRPLLRINHMLSYIRPITCTFKPVKW